MCVSTSAAPAPGSDKALTIFDKILHHQSGFLIDDDRSHRNLDDEILTGFAEPLLFHAVLSVFGLIFLLILEVHQCPEIAICLEYHITAASAVTALRYKWFPPECHRTVSAFTGPDINFRSVNKHTPTSFPVILCILQRDKKTLCIRRCTGSITLIKLPSDIRLLACASCPFFRT